METTITAITIHTIKPPIIQYDHDIKMKSHRPERPVENIGRIIIPENHDTIQHPKHQKAHNAGTNGNTLRGMISIAGCSVFTPKNINHEQSAITIANTTNDVSIR
jgi:hypothetical protein